MRDRHARPRTVNLRVHDPLYQPAVGRRLVAGGRTQLGGQSAQIGAKVGRGVLDGGQGPAVLVLASSLDGVVNVASEAAFFAEETIAVVQPLRAVLGVPCLHVSGVLLSDVI